MLSIFTTNLSRENTVTLSKVQKHCFLLWVRSRFKATPCPMHLDICWFWDLDEACAEGLAGSTFLYKKYSLLGSGCLSLLQGGIYWSIQSWCRGIIKYNQPNLNMICPNQGCHFWIKLIFQNYRFSVTWLYVCMGWIKPAVDRTLGYSTEKRSWTFSIKPSNSEINVHKIPSWIPSSKYWKLATKIGPLMDSGGLIHCDGKIRPGLSVDSRDFRTSIRWKDPPCLIWVN